MNLRLSTLIGRVLCVLVLMIIVSRQVEAGSVSLAWNPNPETNVVGYSVYYGTASGTYIGVVDVGNVTSWTVTGLTDGQLHYFAVDAYTSDGAHSPRSAEVSGVTATSAAASLTTPTPSSILTGSSVQFQWSAGAGVSQYRLSVGTTFGAANLFDQIVGTNVSQTVTGLPTMGGPLHVRLWSLIAATWRFNDYSYTAANMASTTRIIALTGSLAFSATQIGSTSSKTLMIANSGNSAMTVSAITYPAGFGGNWSGTIPAGGSQAVTVTFSPAAATTYSATITVNANQTSGTATISAAGTGTACSHKCKPRK